jgi:hypothetical protein
MSLLLPSTTPHAALPGLLAAFGLVTATAVAGTAVAKL